MDFFTLFESIKSSHSEPEPSLPVDEDGGNGNSGYGGCIVA
jgi:hypothetical protein